VAIETRASDWCRVPSCSQTKVSPTVPNGEHLPDGACPKIYVAIDSQPALRA
jgi:hypothetical protein